MIPLIFFKLAQLPLSFDWNWDSVATIFASFVGLSSLPPMLLTMMLVKTNCRAFPRLALDAELIFGRHQAVGVSCFGLHTFWHLNLQDPPSLSNSGRLPTINKEGGMVKSR